jgi:hypothetical protein
MTRCTECPADVARPNACTCSLRCARRRKTRRQREERATPRHIEIKNAAWLLDTYFVDAAIDRALGRRLEAVRGRGAGSFAALASVLEREEFEREEMAHAAE